MRRYPLEPLLEVLAARGIPATHHALGEHLNLSGTSLLDAKRRGLVVKAADRLADRIGLHPSEVWPSWFDDAIEDAGRECDNCGARFIPARRDARFCQPVCYRRWWGREAVRRRRQRPELAEANRARRRRYYAENAEYEKARERRRYQANRAAS